MKLVNKYIGYSNIEYIVEYEDCDDFSILPYEKCTQCYAVCFTGNSSENYKEICIVHNEIKNTWGLIGGTIENGETFEETLRREILEEGNLRLIDYKPIGYQKVIDTRDNSFVYQLRFMCNASVLGTFEKDPAGTIDKIAFINPQDYKKYFDWGKIAERIIKKGIDLKNKENLA